MISDIHGNEPALRAVLADIESAGADRIVCLGDVATLGPSPTHTIELLRDVGCPCIMGNHDEFLLDPELVHRYTEAPLIVEAVTWCRARLSDADLEFISGFEALGRLKLDHGMSALFYHGSPTSHTENLLATTPTEEIDRLLAGHTATFMVGGHTHLQMVRQHRGNLLINPGSVGLPFKEFPAGQEPTLLGHSEYALVAADGSGVSITLRRVPFDLAAHRGAIANSDHPMRGWLLGQYH